MFNPNSTFLFKRSGVQSKNRVVLAAMTNKQSFEDGTISIDEINWLSRRAQGGFGIITTAATHVSKYGQGWEGEFGVFDDLPKAFTAMMGLFLPSYFMVVSDLLNILPECNQYQLIK